MGTIQFQVDRLDLLSETAIDSADFVTFDGRVISANSEIHDRRLVCNRDQHESSRLRILCHVDNRRPSVMQTTSLRETDQPYQLEVELARGELSRLRNHYGMWTGAGLKTTDEVERANQEAHKAFRRAAIAPGSIDAAIESLCLAQDASDLLCNLYTQQRLAFRRQRSAHFPVFLGCRLASKPTAPEVYLDAFNAVMVDTNWSVLEPSDGKYDWTQLDELIDWATENRLHVMGGPLVDLTHDRFPEWMKCWRGDLVNTQSFTADFVETVVGHCIGRIRNWEVVCGANRGGACGLTEEQRLNLVVRAVEAAREVDEQIQVSLRVIQPWGEYISSTQNQLPPIQFIDTLRRSGVSIAEVNLDIRFGSGHFTSLPRDVLALSQLLDHWSLLQIPLNVITAVPPAASICPADSNDPAATGVAQAEWMEQLLLMCLSKERVTGVYCNCWETINAAGEVIQPTECLVTDKEGSLHPAFDRIRELEQRYWPE